jgi:EpsI family protein
MQIVRVAVILAALMCGVSAAAILARPDAAKAIPPELERNVPSNFSDWKKLPDNGALVNDPETVALLKKLYGEILTRSYVNKDGYRIMLSLAWGANQNGNLQAHKPDVCYPAQGFKLLMMREDDKLATAFGGIDVVRLDTILGSRHDSHSAHVATQ